MDETVVTFTKKAEHFDGVLKVYKPFTDQAEKVANEAKEVVTTVEEKLDYAMVAVIRAMDATISKEETNASGKANAELIVEGENLGRFSATSLIAMEKIVTRIRDEYKTIPTLDPTRRWDKETVSGRDLYIAPIDIKYRVIRTNKPLILAPATDKHPAQVQLVQDEEQVGQYETTYTSGRLSPGEKSKLLERIDLLILAIKRAREEANTVEVVNTKIGDKIFKFIHG